MAGSYEELQELKAKAARKGLSMSELGRRGGNVSGVKRRKAKAIKDRFERLRDSGALAYMDY